MFKNILILSSVVSSHIYGVSVYFNGQKELSTETQNSFDRFCKAPETQPYLFLSQFLSKLPIMNGAIIDNNWFLTAAHTFDALPYFYGEQALNVLKTEGILFQGNKIIMDTTPIRHSNYDLALVKIKSIALSPLERVRNFQEINNSNPLILLFSRTVHLNNSLDKPNFPSPNLMDRKGLYASLVFDNKSNHVTNFRTQNTLGVEVRSYTGDSGSPILSWSNSKYNIQENLPSQDNIVRLLGIAISMGGDNISSINVNQPTVNEWIDYTILSEAIK